MKYVKHMRLGGLLFVLVLVAVANFWLAPWLFSRPVTDQYFAEKMTHLIGVIVGWVGGRHWSYGDNE